MNYTDEWPLGPPLPAPCDYARLDTLKFVDIQDEQPKIDALKSGGIQMAFLRNAAAINVAKSTLPGYYETNSVSDVIQINQREGRPGSDVRVRQALQLAIDPKVVDVRARDGEGMPGKEIFQPWSKWNNDVPVVEVNAAEATKLVTAAKADGFSGNMTYFTSQTQAGTATALAIQAMLAPVGINVNIEYGASVTDIVKRLYVDKDFDIATGALSINEAAPYMRLFSALDPSSTNNIGGVNDPKLTSILTAVQTAPDDAAKKAALADLQTEVYANVPFATLGAAANFVPWTENVHGAVPSMDAIILLDKTWIK